MKSTKVLPLAILTIFTACTELDSMIDVKEILSGVDCNQTSRNITSDNISSVPELDKISYQEMVENL